MDERWRASLWQQYGAAIDMLAQPLRACPDELWQARVWNDPFAEFWNVGYHAIFWLDLYLSGTADGFAPPAPFTLNELEPEGAMPPRVYSRDELLGYLGYAREKCRSTIAVLNDERAWRPCAISSGELPFVELQLYTLRHVQEHAAQLSLLLGERGDGSFSWVSRAG